VPTVVVDAMVFAYAFLGEPRFRDESLLVLQTADEIVVPDSFRAELASVVWQWVRAKRVPLGTGIAVLRDADSVVTQVVPSDAIWERALELAVQADHSTYDALFVAVAEHAGTSVVSYDEALRRAFPEVVVRPGEWLASLECSQR
jgi:predicted nucleic acid-binding protein